MRKVVLIAICILGTSCFSPCRSTYKPCGLADNIKTDQTILQQADLT
jgi:hypothetical protein